jgi:hypothetical protein
VQSGCSLVITEELKDSVDVRFEVLTAVTMKTVAFWDVSLYGSCKDRHIRSTYRLHLQGENNQQSKNTLAVASNCSML